MGFKNMPKYKKNTIYAVLGAVAAYLILNFVILDVKIGEQIFGLINSMLYGKTEYLTDDLIAMLFDGVICIGGLIFWIFFFGQFVLPTHTLGERASIPPLIFRTLIGGEKGPALFIRDGKLVERLEESERKGPGVIVLDSASAAVLTKKGKFSRAVGPGLVFTKKNEVIADTVDLRTQVRTIGPDKDDKFFFSEAKDDKEAEQDPLADLPEAKNQREARRMQTSGLTRDGIEVIPSITVVFKLDANPGEGHSQFGYQHDSVKKAVWHQAIVSGDSPGTHQKADWEWLPALLAADLWREYLRKFKLNELFNITEAKNSQDGKPAASVYTGDTNFDKTAFNIITEMIKLRLTQPYVEVLDDVGHPLRGRERSHEYQLLYDHGIRVVSVSINKLHLKDEDSLIKRWDATWAQQALIQESNTAKRHELRKRKGEEQAVIDFSLSATRHLYRDLTSPTPERLGLSETLRRLLRSTLASVVRDPSMLEKMTDESTNLDNIIEWLSNYQNGPNEK
jgi:hypothetical protein